MDSQHEYRFSVDYRLRLFTTEEAFRPGNETLLTALGGDGQRRVLVCVDAGLLAARPNLCEQIHAWFAAHAASGVQLVAQPEPIVGGEAAKADLSVVQHVAELCHQHGICRHSYVLAIGGGAVLDAVGLAAALVHRGVRLIRLPSTVLAQDDAGLGVKNGINAFGNKNFLGSFAPPWAIVNDLQLLESLDDRHWRAGISEALKVGIIKDAAFVGWLCAHARQLAERDRAAMRHCIQRSAELHLSHIAGSGDPFETGNSRPLDFGHWAAHRLEILSAHRLSHGEAVAIGIALDLLYARGLGLVAAADADAVLDCLQALGFRLYDRVLDLRGKDGRRSLLAGLEQFQEHLGGRLTLAMPDGLGQRRDLHSYDASRLDALVAELRQRDRQRSPSTPRLHAAPSQTAD